MIVHCIYVLRAIFVSFVNVESIQNWHEHTPGRPRVCHVSDKVPAPCASDEDGAPQPVQDRQIDGRGTVSSSAFAIFNLSAFECLDSVSKVAVY